MKKIVKRFIATLAVASLLSPIVSASVMPQVTAATEGAPIIVDGIADDWDYITPIYSGGGVISKVSAFVTEDTLYGKMQLSTTSNFDTWHIYFETDGDTTNHLLNNGAEYLIETDSLYVYKGENGEWDGLEGTGAAIEDVLSDDKKVLEFAVPMDALGNPENIGVHLATVSNWADVANSPSNPGEYLDVPKYEDVVSDEIVGITEEEQLALAAINDFTGLKSQWDVIDYNSVYKNVNLKSLKAVTDGENLFVNCSAKLLSSNFTVYISTDTSTYELKSDGMFYTTKDGKKTDMGTKLTGFFKADNGFEASIPVEMLDCNEKVFEVYIDDDGERLPDAEGETIKATAPIAEAAPTITLDGKDDDWKDVEPIAEGEGTLGDLYAIRDNDALYVMTYIKDVKDPESSASYTTSLFIGIDNDETTGCVRNEYTKHNMADILIEDWYSYGPQRNLEIFHAPEYAATEWAMKNMTSSVEGYEKVFAETSTPGVYCAEYCLPLETLDTITETYSDDFYICIDRFDCQQNFDTGERYTPEGYAPARGTLDGSFALVPKYQIKFDISCEDGDLSDWEKIPVGAKHENVLNLYAVKSDEKLYTMIATPGDMTTNNKYYISTDKEGYTFDGREEVSYYVEKGKLYEVIGNDTLSEDSVNIYQRYETDNCLMQIYLSNLDNPSRIRICTDTNDGQYVLPRDGMLAVTKTIEEKREEGLYYPVENFDFYNNPYKGWVGWADINEVDIDKICTEYKLLYVGLKWKELEPEKGVYAFDELEKQYQFDKWKDKGYRMVLRFIMDNPGYDGGDPDEPRMDIPQWLYDELEEENAEGGGAGTWYLGQSILSVLGGCGFSPNYKSPKLFEYHDKAIKALAERYDDPSITAYVEVGSLGHWAEFHTWPEGTGEFPEVELAQKYMESYNNYFKNVKVGIRKPYPFAAQNNWGLYNDIFGVTSDDGTSTFLKWTESGNYDMPGGTAADIAASAMPDWWKVNFSGGEFAAGDFKTNALDENICTVLKQMRDSHTTWLGPCSAAFFQYGDPTYDDFLYNIETMVRTMGYRYNLYSISNNDLAFGKSNEVKMVWNNSGVAPIYYNCPVTLMLKDASGNVAYEQVLDVDTTTWLPGKTNVSVSFDVPADVAEGEYTLAVKMVAPDTDATIIKLAMENGNEDGTYDLCNVKVAENVEAPASDDASETTETDGTTPVVETGFDLACYIALGVVAVIIVAMVILAVKKKDKKVK